MESVVQYTTRPATSADHDNLSGPHVATMRDYVAQTWGWEDAVQERMFRDAFDPLRIEVIERNGRPVGMWSIDELDGEIFLRSIEIDPAHQRSTCSGGDD